VYLKLTNKQLGVAVEITNAANRIGYDLLYTDTDADRVIVRKYFPSLMAAEAYAKDCVADEVPAGTTMRVH
jgi:hypothetical protein